MKLNELNILIDRETSLLFSTLSANLTAEHNVGELSQDDISVPGQFSVTKSLVISKYFFLKTNVFSVKITMKQETFELQGKKLENTRINERKGNYKINPKAIFKVNKKYITKQSQGDLDNFCRNLGLIPYKI